MNLFRVVPLALFSLVSIHPALAAGQPALAAAVSVAPVSRVVLYPGSALIERIARVRAGDEGLEISGLPANFDTDSVQVEADSGIEIGEIVWRDSARTQPLNAEEARLEAEVRRLSDRIDTLNVEKQAAERELKYLDALVVPGEGFQSGAPAKTLETIRQGSIQAQRRILNVDAQKRDLERELKARVRDLNQIRPHVDQVRVLSVRLSAKNDGQIRLRYLFQDAGWRPAYRALLNSESGKVTLERTAQIAQRSGEDWNRVSLALSTGQPRQSASGAQPIPWGLSLYSEEVTRSPQAPMSAPAPMARYKALGNAAGSAAVLAEDAAFEPQQPLFEVEVTQSEYATEYAISGVVTLPADGRKVAVSLGKLQVSVTLQAQIAPRLEKSAYLVAQGDLPEGVWPVGEMQLYRNGAYVGTTLWNAGLNARLALPFGRDALIRVSSKSLAQQSGSSGFVGQNSERHIADVFTILNQHKRPIEVLVLDASPVGRDEKVEVERHFTPAISQEDWDDRPGVIAWKAELEAGASKEFSADYRIRWPKDRRIIGLP
ncbi:hypothetical protein AGMMS49545_22040 [Betaproteobacteria bacterium]|nr:hypothetical protein AGMMS49545_22040 [Betaproteobacteria bacterium]GHU45038.1 hypothetical protein AGMMS50289_15110 [Betaproteobacteria bacterium]